MYVHVPFCATKCEYCDFYSLARHEHEAEAYLDALEAELKLQTGFFASPPRIRPDPVRPTTLFIGGGTPTLLTPDQLARLLTLLRSHLDLSSLQEFTIEANPNTFQREKAEVLQALGVTRISFGAQSFVPSELRSLQRDHDPESVPDAFATARAAGIHNLSLDLIFGIPGQTLDSWEYSLSRALELEPNHMSCYSLIYEPNTAMTARLRRGEFQPIEEELELSLFEHVYHRLRGAGFQRYETSNYARVDVKGRSAVCLHNIAYWKAANWLAFGPGGGAHVSLAPLKHPLDENRPVAWQWKNVASLNHYLAALLPGGSAPPLLPISTMEALPRRPWAAGAAIFWLRLAQGLRYREFAARTGIDPKPILERAFSRYQDLGVAECSSDAAVILERGVAVSDRILAHVLTEFESAPHA